MLCIDEQRKVFETFCAERYGENGCQTSKTIVREKGQKIIRLLQDDPAAEAIYLYFLCLYMIQLYCLCYHNCLHATVIAIITVDLEIAQA